MRRGEGEQVEGRGPIPVTVRAQEVACQGGYGDRTACGRWRPRGPRPRAGWAVGLQPGGPLRRGGQLRRMGGRAAGRGRPGRGPGAMCWPAATATCA